LCGPQKKKKRKAREKKKGQIAGHQIKQDKQKELKGVNQHCLSSKPSTNSVRLRDWGG